MTHYTVNFLTPTNDELYAADVYEPLDVATKEIRVVELFCGQKDDKIRLRFHQHITPHDLTIRYQALSYVAGDVNDTAKVWLDDIPVKVFASVGLALARLRQAEESVYLWIDQLCIDQSDVDERAQQVQMMKDIYARASQVIVWLDDSKENDATTTAFNFVAALKFDSRVFFKLHRHTFSTRSKRYLSDRLLTSTKEAEMQLTRTRRYSSGSSSSDDSHGYAASMFPQKHRSSASKGSDEESQSEDDDDPHSRYRTSREKSIRRLISRMRSTVGVQDIKAFLQLLSKPWWTRCWTLQEAVLGSWVTLRCGRLIMPLWDADCAFSLICRAYQTFSLDFPRLARWQYERHEREMLISGPQHAIALRLYRRKQRVTYFRGSEMLYLTRQRGATDKRDLVYSILGLINPDYDIRVSYTSSNTVADTFINAAIAVISYEGDLDFISQAGEMHRNKELDLPSWVPDLTVEPAPFNLFSIATSTLHDVAAPNASFLFGQPLGTRLFGHKVEKPLFIAETKGEQPRIIQVTILELGRLAEEILSLDDMQGESEDKVWDRCDVFARELIGSDYRWTEPHCRERLEKAVDTTLAAGFSSDGTTSHWVLHDEDVNEFTARKRRSAVLRDRTWRLFVTPDRKMGLCPSTARKTDLLCIALRSRAPWILRPSLERNGHFTFVGPCYLHGYMQGQALMECWQGRRVPVLKTIRLL